MKYTCPPLWPIKLEIQLFNRYISITMVIMDNYVLSCGSGNVTCRGFGLLTQNTITFNSRVYCDSPSLEEYLLRCGIDTNNINVFTSRYNHTKRFTCGEHLLRCGIDTSIYIVIIIINSLQSNELSRTTAHLLNHAAVHVGIPLQL